MNAKEQQKEKDERSILDKFLLIHPGYSQAEISKKEHPDFVLTMPSGKQVGIEVTRFITETDKVIQKIVGQYSESEQDVADINKAAVQDHGAKAELYTYRKLAGRTAIGPGPFLIRTRKEEFASRIIEKYEKYKSKMDSYDQFIILCDARDGLIVTDEEDAKEIIEMALQKKVFPKSFKIAILYSAFGNVDTNFSCYFCTVNVISVADSGHSE